MVVSWVVCKGSVGWGSTVLWEGSTRREGGIDERTPEGREGYS